MFDRVSEAAENLATSVSRRAFMGKLGKWALAVAGAVGAFAAVPSPLQAGNPNYHWICCVYSGGATLCQKLPTPCPSTYNGSQLDTECTVSGCKYCFSGACILP
jgi:hypothetical protein